MCEYCDHTPSSYEKFYVWFFKQTSATNVEESQIEANYCPNCGRKLNKVSNDMNNNIRLIDDNVLITQCKVFSKYVDSEDIEYYVCHGCLKKQIKNEVN